MYKHAKNQAVSLFCYRDIGDLKILQSDWPRRFWPISRESDFSQVWDLCKNTTNNINSEKIQKKLMTKFSNKFKKPYFWPIFHIFWSKKIIFSKNSAPSRKTPQGLLTTSWVLEKHNQPIPRKLQDRRTDGWTLIHKTLPVKVGGPIKVLTVSNMFFIIISDRNG